MLWCYDSSGLWNIDTDTDTGHETDTDTWTPVKHIKLNPDMGVGVVSVSYRTPDTARGWGVRAS